jgi:hypothetical protein
VKSLSYLLIGSTCLSLGVLAIATPASAATLSATYTGDIDGLISANPLLVSLGSSWLGTPLPSSIGFSATNLSGSYTLDPARFLDGELSLETDDLLAYIPASLSSYLGDALSFLNVTPEEALVLLDDAFDYSLTGTGTVSTTSSVLTPFSISYLNSSNTVLLDSYNATAVQACLSVSCAIDGVANFGVDLVFSGFSTILDKVLAIPTLTADIKAQIAEVKQLLAFGPFLTGGANKINLFSGEINFNFLVNPIGVNPLGTDESLSLLTGNFEVVANFAGGQTEVLYSASLDEPIDTDYEEEDPITDLDPDPSLDPDPDLESDPGIDPIDASADGQSVPEPGLLVGLASVAGLALRQRRQRLV